jgi:hypothetical protein
LEKNLLEKYPLSWLLIYSLTIYLDEFDALAIFNDLNKQNSDEIWSNFIEMMSIGVNYEHKVKLINNFKLESKNLTEELLTKIKGDESIDLLIKSLANNRTDENKDNIDQVGLV